MGCAYFGMTRGMSWSSFFLIFAAVFIYMIWIFVHEPASTEHAVTPDAANAAPTEAIDALMDDYRNEGYLVEHVKDLEQDPENYQRVIIEYVVKKWDESESWTYTWAWEVPFPLTSTAGIEHMEQYVYERQFTLCRLIPISEPAIAIQETLDQYIAASGE